MTTGEETGVMSPQAKEQQELPTAPGAREDPPLDPADTFSSCLQSFPAPGSFAVSQFFSSGSQNVGASSFSISPSNEYSVLISFRIDWLDLLAVQGTLKSLLQHHSSKPSILQCSAFYIIQLSSSIHDYWKNHSFD